MRRSVLMTRLVTRSGRVGLTRMWTFLAAPGSALGVADDPAHGVAGGDRTGADELLAVLQRDVGDLAGRGIDLIERAAGEGIDLHGVDEAVAHRLDAGGGVGLVDARCGVRRLGRAFAPGQRLQLAGQRQRLRQLHDLAPAPADRPAARPAPRDRRSDLRRLANARSRRARMRTSAEAPTRICGKMLSLSWREAGTVVPRKGGVIVRAPSTS